ncbi:MAG TPA: hypothetical protein VM658_14600 [bacterium]|nr:hypothetical protein [bacterium]
MKNNLEIMSRIAVFRTKEAEPGEPSETGGVALDLDSGSAIRSAPAAAHDGDTVHGSELPTAILAPHCEASGSLSQKRAKPDLLAFVLAYFFGECASNQVSGTAYRHEISPAAGPYLPTFTAIQRRGAGVFTERLAGNYIEGFTMALADGWVSLSADVVGTGAREVNYERETVAAPANAQSITLAANAVEGATAAARLANVYRVRAKDAGSDAWQTLSVASVSADTPAVIAFNQALGESGDDVDYQVDYIPAAPAWCALPAAVDESPLKLVEARVVVDGYYNGSSLTGGEELKAEVMGFTISGKNNLELRHFPGATGPAALAARGARDLTVSLTESLRDTVLLRQADHPETEHVGVALVVRGAEIEPESGAFFGAEIIFPCCGIVAAPVELQGKRLAIAGDLVVMDDGAYGGAVVKCFNRQTGYL